MRGARRRGAAALAHGARCERNLVRVRGGLLVGIRGAEENQLTGYLRAQAQAAYEIVDAHLAGRRFMVGDAPTVADISMAGYLYYNEDARFDRSQFANVQAWAGRISELPRWQHPYELMPRAIREGN